MIEALHDRSLTVTGQDSVDVQYVNYTPSSSTVFNDPIVDRAVAAARAGTPPARELPEDLLRTQREGVTRTIDKLKAQSSLCPDQRIVVAGYSEGAWVLGDALSDPELQPIYDRIETVLLFGDPMFDPNSDAAVRTVPGQTGPEAGPRNSIGIAAYARDPSPEPPSRPRPRSPYLPETLERRAQSYCWNTPVDPVCTTPGANVSGTEWAQEMDTCRNTSGLLEQLARLGCRHAWYTGDYAAEYMRLQPAL
ncbi:hypothetical protein GCM10017771_97470 [Streptomyces capitiformicae]|uniref:Cutinase n=1 Tax=Streptomyces capitiformicae TaxID=2014920 RepID=A0A918ZXY5_9ACTN|nr:hypothetical protein GCM10017771_97470 [Streptomyces capitiformicae]